MTATELRPGAGGRSATVLRSVEELEALRSTWTARSVDADIDYYITVIRTRSEVIRPHVVRFGGDGAEAMFVGRLELVPLTTSIGYRKIYAPRVRALTQVHGGLIGADDPATMASVVAELRAELAAGEADVLRLPAVPVESALSNTLAVLPFLQRGHRSSIRTRWQLRLPETYEEFLRGRSKSTREYVRRYGKRFEKAFGDEIDVAVYRRPDELDAILRDLPAVAAKTYQHGLGVAFGDSPEHLALTKLGLERGWFRAYVLSVGGAPVAFWHGTAYGGSFSTGTPGFDPAYRDHRVGIYLLLRVIEDLCGDDGVSVLDYGFGEADYKRQFGNESWLESDVLVFAPSFKAARVNLTRTAIAGSADVAKRTLDRLGVLDSVKRRWRGRLASGSDG
jgi:CelD/BcsL family acetyltransferase involved in cellulose biosynthesis